MSDKSVDLARSQLALTGGKIAEISCGSLTEALRVNFLYGNTSSREESHNPGSG